MPRLNPLAQYGLSITPEQLGRVAFNQLEEDYPGWSCDKLVTNPQEAIRFCNTIQVLFRTPIDAPIPDEVILKALLAARKQGKKRLGK